MADLDIDEFAKSLLARAKAREQMVLKRQGQEIPKADVDAGKLIEKPGANIISHDITTVKEITKSPSKLYPVLPPDSPGNKENVGSDSMLEDEEMEDVEKSDVPPVKEVEQNKDDKDEEIEGESDQEDDGESVEHQDEVLPLSTLLHKSSGLVVAGGASASPVSRKSRLSALANTINSWEDDLTPSSTRKSIVPQKQEVKRAPRFSVSTSSPARTAQVQAQRSTTHHQFVRSKSASPTKIVTPSKTPAVSSPARPTATPTPSSPLKPARSQQETSDSRSASPVKVSLSPVKKQLNVSFSTVNSSPIKPNRSPQKQQQNESFSARNSNNSSPIKTNFSPQKAYNISSGITNKDDSLVKNLELQGFVKLQAGQLQQVLEQQKAETAPPKVVKSIMKKPAFEKTQQPIPKSTVSAPSPSQWQLKHHQEVTKPQQFNSRKSLQMDPSELSVAQKAKLFERQQQEQEQMIKQQNATKRKPMISLVETKAKITKPNEQPVKSPMKNEKMMEQPASPKKTFYFGDSTSASPVRSSGAPPPPPPLPQNLLSPANATSSTATKSSPWKRSYCEEEDVDDCEYPVQSGPDSSMNSSLNTSKSSSPSAQIAMSVKRIKVIQKEDKMYPSLTDIESTEVEETDMDNEDNTSSVASGSPNSHSLNSSMSTSSLGSFIQTKAQSTTMTSELNATMACRQIDQLIDDALEGQIIEDDTFMMDEPLSSSSPIVKKPNYQPLMHTVSLYRKNQQSQFKKPDASEIAALAASSMPVMNEVPEEDEEGIEELHDKVQGLEQQILIQQKSIAQASKALNICEASFEFTNSTENVEGERVLLIATQKRCQLLSYINKLKNGIRSEPDLSPSKDKFKPSSTRGTIKIDSIQLYPIKSARLHKDYVYHFIVILKHNENVHATCTVKTSASNTVIDFPNEFLLQEIDPSFKIQIEVYALRTFKQMDVIPHNMKYHIKSSAQGSSGSCSTPSKTSTLSHFLTPTRSSKHTPKSTDMKSTGQTSSAISSNAIRTANFTLQAVLNLNLSNLNNKTEWEMSMVNSNLILPNISMNIKCTNKNELNYKGFLTVFSDVSGLGAWHRRWAMINENYQLLFWTYPEDEAHGKPPVLSLSLSTCITPRIAPTPREQCARPNTFLLVTTRKPLESDRDSLVVSVHEKYTAIKHLISADNRMERDTWIGFINKALTNMRAWGINQRSERDF